MADSENKAQIIGIAEDGPGSNRIDAAVIGQKDGEYTFTVYEAKGGDSLTLGEGRWLPDDTRAEQGTYMYMKDLLSGKNADDRVLKEMQEFAPTAPSALIRST